MASPGLVHYSIDSPVWLLIFGATVLIGLMLLVWGSRMGRSVLPVPRISLTIDWKG
jgi:hypothetical protein